MRGAMVRHQFQQTHQPWCRIFHNPGMTTECWCDAQMAATAYKLGVAEGMAMLAFQNHAQQANNYREADDLVPINALPEVVDVGH